MATVKFQIQSNAALINYYLNTGDDHGVGYFSECFGE